MYCLKPLADDHANGKKLRRVVLVSCNLQGLHLRLGSGYPVSDASCAGAALVALE